MAGIRDLTLIVNPNAGKGKAARLTPTIVATLQSSGSEPLVQFTRSLGHAQELAKEAVHAKRIPVAVGGDGLINSVVNAVADSGAVMAIVPVGRGNDFARALGIKGVENALEILQTSEPKSIDLGHIRDRYFSCVASVGIDSRVMETAEKARILKGSIVYAYATLRALVGWKTTTFEVEVDGTSTRHTGYSVAVANGPYFGGGMRLAPQASFTDGELDLVTIGDVSKAAFLNQGVRVFWGGHVGHPAVHIQRAKRVVVDAGPDLALYADGERIGAGPAVIEIRPGALRILA